MQRLHPVHAALAVGTVMGLWHALWCLLVAAGLAQPFLDWVLRLHFIAMDWHIAPFAIDTALTLVGLTFAIGCAVGLLFALVWNALARRGSDL